MGYSTLVTARHWFVGGVIGKGYTAGPVAALVVIGRDGLGRGRLSDPASMKGKAARLADFQEHGLWDGFSPMADSGSTAS